MKSCGFRLQQFSKHQFSSFIHALCVFRLSMLRSTTCVLIPIMCIAGRLHTPLDLSEEEWNNIIKTNLTGTWLVSKYVCIRMRDAKQGGCVINISSISGLNRGQLPGGLAYASAKVAINTMTKVSSLTVPKFKF